jgi:CHAT domain-containing protein/tetratricopeptide (TPR) repeat protein
MFEQNRRPRRSSHAGPVVPERWLLLLVGFLSLLLLIVPAPFPVGINKIIFVVIHLLGGIFIIFRLEFLLNLIDQACTIWQKIVLILALTVCTGSMLVFMERLSIYLITLGIIIIGLTSYIFSHRRTRYPDALDRQQSHFHCFTQFYGRLANESRFVRRQKPRKTQLLFSYGFVLLLLPFANALPQLLAIIPRISDVISVVALANAILVLLSFVLGIILAVWLVEVSLFNQLLMRTGFGSSLIAGVLILFILTPWVSGADILTLSIVSIMVFPGAPFLGVLLEYVWIWTEFSWFMYKYYRTEKTPQDRIKLCTKQLRRIGRGRFLWFEALLQMKLAENYLASAGSQWKIDTLHETSKQINTALEMYEKFDKFSLRSFSQDYASLKLGQGTVSALKVYYEEDSWQRHFSSAIDAYNKALEFFEEPGKKVDNVAPRRIMTLYNLGVALVTRVHREQQTLVDANEDNQAAWRNAQEQAIEHLEESRAYYEEENDAIKLAMAHYSLGIAFWQRLEGQRDENLVYAQDNLGKANTTLLKFGDIAPELQAIIQHRLGTLDKKILDHPILDNETSANDATLHMLPLVPLIPLHGIDNLGQEADEAAEHFEAALQVFGRPLQEMEEDQSDLSNRPAFPWECYCAAYMLGMIRYAQRSEFVALEQPYEPAYLALARAHQALEYLRADIHDTHNEHIKRLFVMLNRDLYMRLVHSCVEMRNLAEAFQYTSAAKGRLFVDQLKSANIDLEKLAEKEQRHDVVELVRNVHLLRQEIHQLKQMELQAQGIYQFDIVTQDKKFARTNRPGETEPGFRPSEEVRQQRHAKMQEEYAIWEAIRLKIPQMHATASVPPLTAAAAHQLADTLDATLIEYYRHMGTWCAFIFCPKSSVMGYINLPEVDPAIVGMQQWVEEVEEGSWRGRASYHDLEQWYAAVFKPIDDYISKTNGGNRASKNLVIAPYGELHTLPIGLALDPAEARYVIDKYTLSFVPSLCALSVLVEQQRQRTLQSPDNENKDKMTSANPKLLTAVYPGVPGEKNFLQYAVEEGQRIIEFTRQAGQYVTEALYDTRASTAEIIKHARDSDVIHAGCHAFFDQAYPEKSALLFADGRISVIQALTEIRLERGPLLSLAACLTGKARFDVGDNLIGLTQVMLLVGARAVVSTFWRVDDAATSLLMIHFYWQIARGRSPAVALQRAMQFVREQQYTDQGTRRPCKWQHPYFWGAFQINGLALLGMYDDNDTSSSAPVDWQVETVFRDSIRRNKHRSNRMTDQNPDALHEKQTRLVLNYLKAIEAGLAPANPDPELIAKFQQNQREAQALARFFERLAQQEDATDEIIIRRMFEIVEESPILHEYLVDDTGGSFRDCDNTDRTEYYPGTRRGISKDEYQESTTPPRQPPPMNKEVRNRVRSIRDKISELLPRIEKADLGPDPDPTNKK